MQTCDKFVPQRRAVRVSLLEKERHQVYKEEQDLSGVLKTDGPLGCARMVAAGSKRRTGGDGSSGYGYVVWADRDSGKTSKCKMKAGAWCHGSSSTTQSLSISDLATTAAVLSTGLLLAERTRSAQSPDGK